MADHPKFRWHLSEVGVHQDLSEGPRESAVRISLIDVMYGVVMSYGFGLFDQIRHTEARTLFFLSYAVIIIDWLYVHRLYWGWEYRYNTFFLLDIFILFCISRLMFTAIGASLDQYWFWMAMLFALYVIWDCFARIKGLDTEYDWRYSILGDSGATILFLGVYVLLATGTISVNMPSILLGVLIYLGAVLTWFKKVERRPTVVAETPDSETPE